MPADPQDYLQAYCISTDMAEVQGQSWPGWQESGIHGWDVQQQSEDLMGVED